MSFSSWLRLWKTALARTYGSRRSGTHNKPFGGSRRRSKRTTAGLQIELLEDRVVPANLTPLASFDGSNGAYPYGGLIQDNSGNLFGTTAYGGASGVGSVFEI